MTVVAVVKTQLRSVNRKAEGETLGISEGNINGAPLLAILTATELHISWIDRSGPSFVINLNNLLKSTVNEIEVLLGQKAVTR